MSRSSSILLVVVSSWLGWPADGLAKRPLHDEPLCTAPSSQHRPRIIADGKGGAIVAWQDFRSNWRAENYAQRLGPSGRVDPRWPVDGRYLANGVDSQKDAVIVPDGAGGAIVAWQVVSGERDHIVYVHHLMASGDLDPTWPSGGCALSPAPGVQRDPVIVGDGAGGAIVAWEDYRAVMSDIYAQHVLASGALDPAWPADGVALCTAPGYQHVSSIVTDGAGGAIVGWSVKWSDEGDLYAQRVLASGRVDPAWPVDGRALCTANYLQSGLVMAPDGAGGAIAAWNDGRSDGPGEIYAQHVLASGDLSPAWPRDGLAVCTVGGPRVGGIVIDAAGGAFLAWAEARTSHGPDIYAQHLLGSGVDPAWPINGFAVCGTGTIGDCVVAADGAGGAFLAWPDRRGSIYDVYAHHVLSSGVDPDWPTDGLAISTGRSYQIEVAIDADRQGRAFVAWRDFRNDNADIYALRLDRLTPDRPSRPGFRDDPGLHVPRLSHAAGDVTIDFELPEPQAVSITVYDVMGRQVRALAERHEFPAGTHTLTWDGTDDAGAPLKQGVYLVRLSNRNRSVTRKQLLLH